MFHVMNLPPDQQTWADSLRNGGAGEELLKVFRRANRAYLEFAETCRPFTEFVQQFAKEMQGFPDHLRKIWSEAATNGWYFNWHTPITVNRPIQEGKESLDAFMQDHIKRDIDEIHKSLVDSFPNRQEIIDCAFELHKKGTYIGSVPLFFAQADGIFADKFGTELFFNKKEKIAKLDAVQQESSWFLSTLYGVMSVDTQFHAGSSKHSKKRKSLAPSRNGIMHGSRRHLDYGTETNSLKAISLLAFVGFVASGAGET